MMNNIFIREIVKDIIKMLAKKEYDKLYEKDMDKALSVSEIKESIESYGLNLTMPPESAFETMEVYEISNSVNTKIDFDLWFDDIVSDLTLSCTIYNHRDISGYSIENIHVL